MKIRKVGLMPSDGRGRALVEILRDGSLVEAHDAERP